MPHLFDLPAELLTLTLGYLEITDLLHFCATCWPMRSAFRPGHFTWIVNHYARPRPTMVQVLALTRALRESSYLLLCHAFLELFQLYGPWHDYELLIQHGASFRPILHGGVLEQYFRTYGPGDGVNFLLKHGLSFDSIPSGANRLLEDALRSQDKARAAFLIQHGASMRQLPSGPEQLLRDLFGDFRRIVPWQHVLSILEGGRPLRYVPKGLERWLMRHFYPDITDILIPLLPNGLNVMLKIALCKYGLGVEVDEFLFLGASFSGISDTGDHLYDQSGIVRAIQARNFNTLSPRGETPLVQTAIVGHVEAMTFLLDSGADYEFEVRNATPLSYAVMHNQLEIAQLLLERGATIDGRTTTCQYACRESPLLCEAARNGRVEMVQLLLTHAADPDVLASTGNTALHLATLNDAWELIRILLDNGACSRIPDLKGYYPLTLAAALGRLASAKVLAIEYEANTWDDKGRTALNAASESGNIAIVQLLLDRGAYVTFPDRDGRTPLFVAAANGHLDIVNLLLQQGADVDAGYGYQTPLHAAAQEGHLSIVQILIQQGADVAVSDVRGCTPLARAIERTHLPVARLLIESKSELETRDTAGRTPLLIAAAADFVQGARLLIRSGADPNAVTNNGDNALHIAAEEGYIATGMAICKFVGVDCQNKSGQTPLHTAAHAGSLDLLRAFIEYGLPSDTLAYDEASSVTPNKRRRKSQEVTSNLSLVDVKDNKGYTTLFTAFEQGHGHMVKYLTSKGVDINIRGLKGRTLLLLAVESEDLPMINTLIESGADLNIADPEGRTPLHVAALHEDPATAALLIDHAAKHADSPEDMPIHVATKAGMTGIMRLFLDRGANMNATTKAGNTPLHIAAECYDATKDFLWEATVHSEIVQDLLSHGAAVDPENACKRTPLMNAVQAKCYRTALLLAEAGADPNRTMDDTTPFHLAVRHGWLGVVRAMHCHGADLEARDQAGLTPLHHAASMGQSAVAAFLALKGADRQARDPSGQLAWDCAVNNGHIEAAIATLPESHMREIVLNNGSMARSGEIQVAEYLFALGIEAAITDCNAWSEGATAGSWSCEESVPETRGDMTLGSVPGELASDTLMVDASPL